MITEIKYEIKYENIKDDIKSLDDNLEPIPIDQSLNEKDNENTEEHELSKQRKCWIITSNLMTFFIPNCILNSNTEIRQAWREKVTIFIFFILTNLFMLFMIEIFPKLICKNTNIYTWNDIYHQKNSIFMVINGLILDASSFVKIHPGKINNFINYSGQDISFLFEKPEIYTLPKYKIYPELKLLYNEYKKNDTSHYCNTNFCHPYQSFENFTIIGDLALSYVDLNKDPNWFILYNKIYNISEYIKYGAPIYPSIYDHTTKRKEMAYYLDERLNSTILNRIGQDATQLFEAKIPLLDRKEIIEYLDKFYYCGILDTRYDISCLILNYTYISIVCIISAILILKFFLSLCMLHKQYPKCKEKYVIVSIPCYTENKESLEKTIHSIYDTEYSNYKKLLCIIVDGIIIGKGNTLSTAEIVLNIFNRSLNENMDIYEYETTNNEKKKNYLKVYYGWHTNNKSTLPYIIFIKCGTNSEKDDPKKGNRGKRDSQIILLKFLKYIHNTYYSTSSSSNIKHEFKMYEKLDELLTILKIKLYKFEYLLTVDADTTIDSDSIIQMVYRMKDPNIIALCGETCVDNKLSSWVTTIQVYEYYFNQNLNKAFESLFSSVTCLPGCFSIYRIKSTCDRNKPIIIHDNIIDEYSNDCVDTMHTKNLLHLGEDRFFTTLLIKYFPNKKLKYITEARCHTIVPDKWSVLLSQRRRWINSTMHNLFELMFIDRMCGCCCFSMKFLIMFEIITNMFLPSTCIYLFYLIYRFSIKEEIIPIVFIIVITSVVGIQILVFLIKRDLVYIFWLIIYTLSLPIWTIILPIYAFLKMDDFSWGETRKIKKIEK